MRTSRVLSVNSTRPLELVALLPLPREMATRRRSRRRRAATVRAVLVVVLILGALTGAARAQDGPVSDETRSQTRIDPCSELRAASEVIEAEPTRLMVEGTTGMWFPIPIARLMLCEVRELRARRRVSLLDARELSLWELRVDFTERQLELAVEARDRLEAVVDDADRRAREASEELGAWYRSPILWAVIGIVLGGAAVLGGAYVAAAAP